MTPSYPFPTSVTVAGLKITVRWMAGNPEGDFGDYQQGRQLITLYADKLNTQESAWNTLLHELNHASLDLGGISYVLPDDTEEAVVRNHDNILFPVLRTLFRKYPKA